MSKFQLIVALILATILGAGNLFAGIRGEMPVPFPSHDPKPDSRQISWEELRERCENAGKKDSQRAPENIAVQCMDTLVTWEAGNPAEVLMPQERNVAAAVFMDKFHVATYRGNVVTAPLTGSCSRFFETAESFVMEQPVNCSNILAFTGSLKEFCVGMLNATKSKNMKLVNRERTGRMIDTCRNSEIISVPAPLPPQPSPQPKPSEMPKK